MSGWRAWAMQGRRWAFGLAAALLLAQALGLVHHVQHGGGVAPHAATHADCDPAHGHGHGHHHAHDHDLFAGHEAGDAQCRLVDALAGGDALPVAAPALPGPLPADAPPPVGMAAAAPAPAAAPYEARAPPRG